MTIRVLPETLVNRIAAGEVIVRPASVVKELVENSFDAGATSIHIEIANGCRDLLIRDNGSGMDRGDAALCLIRHSTSKITQFDDLYQLSTRGFRGEALASIASVSRLQLLTRRPGDIAGTRIVADGPGEPRLEPAGAPDGTEIRIRELFYNTPARLNFLKSASSELQQILLTITRQALIRPDVGFSVEKEGVSLFNLTAGESWGQRIANLLGSGILENELDVEGERHGIQIRGFVMRPAITRKDRRQQFFYVNGRPVSSRSLSFVLQEAYKGILMVQRFPICVLDITLPPGEVDVNVHPTKEEVRFRNESHVNGAVHRVVQARLQAANLMPEMTFGNDPRWVPGSAPSPTGGSAAGPSFQDDIIALSGERMLPRSNAARDDGRNPIDFSMFTGGLQTHIVPQTDNLERRAASVAQAERELASLQEMSSATGLALAAAALSPESSDEVSDEGRGCSVRPITNSVQRLSEPAGGDAASVLVRNGVIPEPLGQISRCYIVAQAGHDLLLIDQHAAHERLLYLKFSNRQRETPSQPLLVPVSVDVPAAALPYMEKLVPVFAQLGLRVEPFGGQTFLVQSVPADLPKLDPSAVVADLLDDFDSLGRVEQIEVLHDRIITRMACRAAIKAGQSLHMEEMRALIRDIVSARLGFTCPHGRPTMVLLTRDQLDRQFKRKL